MIASLFVIGFATVASAAGDPANVLKYRQNIMRTQTGHMQAIGSVLKGEVSYGAHVLAHAQAIKAISEMVGDLFPAGSAVGDSRAKPEIWQKPKEFQAAYENYKAEAAKLAEVAASGDLGAVGAQMGKLGKSCGGCHKPFRKPKQ